MLIWVSSRWMQMLAQEQSWGRTVHVTTWGPCDFLMRFLTSASELFFARVRRVR